MNPKINSVLSDIRQMVVESIMPVQAIGAQNALDEDTDALDGYMRQSAMYVMRETGLDEDAALDVVFQLAEAGEEAGALPPLPGVDATHEELEEWMTAATDTGFTLQAVLAVREQG